MDVSSESGENRTLQCFQHEILIKFMGNKTLFAAQHKSSEKCSEYSLFRGIEGSSSVPGKLECLAKSLKRTSLNSRDSRYLRGVHRHLALKSELLFFHY